MFNIYPYLIGNVKLNGALSYVSQINYLIKHFFESYKTLKSKTRVSKTRDCWYRFLTDCNSVLYTNQWPTPYDFYNQRVITAAFLFSFLSSVNWLVLTVTPGIRLVCFKTKCLIKPLWLPADIVTISNMKLSRNNSIGSSVSRQGVQWAFLISSFLCMNYLIHCR